jgi:predicted nucleotidyltransferase
MSRFRRELCLWICDSPHNRTERFRRYNVKIMASMQEIQNLADEIARLHRPYQIILFGSHAHGVASESSDVDLLVVMDYSGNAVDEACRIWAAVRPQFPVDLILRRPDDLNRRYRLFDPLAREALDHGRVLYERDRARVAQ